MPIEFKEREVSPILSNLNAFWSSSLMEDRHITDQLWRGYLNVADNLYTQLYQLHFSKSISTITDTWISHWERFDLNQDTRTETFNNLYPYAYKLPKNIRSVYLLRESPREISILPALTLLLNTGAIILPDGTIRHPGDLVYLNKDAFKFDTDCSFCNGTGIADSEPCPVCGASGTVSGISSDYGIGVATVKYLKRADNINDFEEGIVPLGDFVVDEEAKIIAFAKEPYPVLWSEYAVRDTEIIYDNFGSLIKFYKKDSYNYLRQTQGLWYAYWHGAAVRNIEIGLTVVLDLPFVTDAGYVERVDFMRNWFLTSYVVSDLSDLSNRIKLPVFPAEDESDSSALAFELSIKDKPQYKFTHGIDYEIISEFEDAHDYENWYTFEDFNDINSVPLCKPQAYIIFNSTPAVAAIEPGDELLFSFQDGSGVYIITISGRDYLIPDEYLPDAVVNQYLDKYASLTNLVNVYDYINYPKWWENLLGYTHGNSFFGKYGRVRYDSGVRADSGIRLDSFYKSVGQTELYYYHTFLVDIKSAAVPTTVEGMKIIKSFLDTIKPSYSHYIIRLSREFEDCAVTREAHFCLESIFNFKSNQGPIQRYDDSWIRESLDKSLTLDSHDIYEKFFVAKLPLDGINFISDTEIHSCHLDSIEGRRADSGRNADSCYFASRLEISKELP